MWHVKTTGPCPWSQGRNHSLRLQAHQGPCSRCCPDDYSELCPKNNSPRITRPDLKGTPNARSRHPQFLQQKARPCAASQGLTPRVCWELSRACLTRGTTQAGPTDGDPHLPCRRRPHLLAQLRLQDSQLGCGPRQCKAIRLPTGLRPSQQLSQMGQGASEDTAQPGHRTQGR